MHVGKMPVGQHLAALNIPPALREVELYRGSEVQSFLRCRTRWAYDWFHHLKSKTKSDKLYFGDLFHKFAEVYHRNFHSQQAADMAGWAMEQMYESTPPGTLPQTELDNLWTLAQQVTGNYMNMWFKQDCGYRTIATEVTFAIPLAEGIYYTGTIDWVYETSDGYVEAADHKTSSDLGKYEKGSVMDRQISRYVWAMNKLLSGNGFIASGKDELGNPCDWVHVSDTSLSQFQGKELRRFMYNIVARDVPKEPKMVKTGLSKDKAQKTTFNLYAQKAIKLGVLVEVGMTGDVKNLEGVAFGFYDLDGYKYALMDDSYKEVLDTLLAAENEYGNRFFKRIFVERNKQEQQNAIIEFFKVAKEIQRVKKGLTGAEEDYIMVSDMDVYRNINHDCSWDCSYRPLCIGTMDGSNVQVMIDIGYEKKEV